MRGDSKGTDDYLVIDSGICLHPEPRFFFFLHVNGHQKRVHSWRQARLENSEPELARSHRHRREADNAKFEILRPPGSPFNYILTQKRFDLFLRDGLPLFVSCEGRNAKTTDDEQD